MRYSFTGCTLLLLWGAMVRAQTAPSPAERMLNEMLEPASAATAPTSRPGAAPALEPSGYVPKAANAHLLREGSEIIAKSGHLKKSSSGPYPLFVFDQLPNQLPIPPMLVLPNLQLMSMEDAVSATGQNRRFIVSGILTEYKGKNYVLLEPGPDELSRQMPPAPYDPTEARGPVPAEQMLSAMLAAETASTSPPPKFTSPQSDVTSGLGALPPKAPLLAVLPEQTQIFDRACRLSPASDSEQPQLILEADGATLADPPLIVLPNLKLSALEGAAGDHHDTRFRVSGVVTEYRGRNYILLQKVVVMADADRQF